ncbi:MAG: hypothetical protein R3D57_06000 [Hyphomicrobiaceae bacterium]
MAIGIHSLAYRGALALLVLSLGSATPASAEGKDCFKTWDEARSTIQQQGLVSGKTITQQAAEPGHAPPESAFLEAYLCRENDSFVYKLYYIDKSSNVIIKTVDAREPFPLP